MEIQKKYLPLGSVVLLNGGTKKIMVIGYCMRTPEKPNKIFDYCGCVFPEGVLRSDVTCVFDHEQIQEVSFSGCVNEESTAFINRVVELTNEEEESATPPSEEPRFQIEGLEIERL